MMQPKLDPQRKFEEMILLVARASERDLYFGATKLNKILFYIDFAQYRRHHRSISGQMYEKKEFGPVPRGLVATVETMSQRGLCSWAERELGGYRQKRLLALREPDVSLFSGEEIQLVHQVVDDLRDLTGKEVSDLSHRFIGWRAAEYGEEITYGTVFIGEPRPMTPEEVAWAEEVIREHHADEAAVC